MSKGAERAETPYLLDQPGDRLRVGDVARHPDDAGDLRLPEVDGDNVVDGAAQPVDAGAPHAPRRTGDDGNAHCGSTTFGSVTR